MAPGSLAEAKSCTSACKNRKAKTPEKQKKRRTWIPMFDALCLQQPKANQESGRKGARTPDLLGVNEAL